MANQDFGNSEALVRLLLRGYESKDLDYKAPGSWDDADKKARCELVKDILAFANTLGGFLIIGVSEGANGLVYEGLTEDQIATFDSTKINAFVQSYADPPINTSVRKFQHEGKAYVIIEVPQFVDTPHICQKDFPNVLSDRALYVRTANNESAPIRSSADFRLIIETSVRNRSDALMKSMRAILTGGTLAPTGTDSAALFEKQLQEADAAFQEQNPLPNKDFDFFLRTAFIPRDFSEKRFSIQELRDAAFRAQIDFTGWPFLFIHVNRPDVLSVLQTGIQTKIYTDDFFGGKILDFWQFFQSGLFYKKELPHGASEQPDAVIFPYLAQYFGLATDCLVRLYEGLLDPTEPVTLRVIISGTKDRRMVNGPTSLPFMASYVSQIPQIVVEQTHTLVEWKAGIQEFATEMMGEVQMRFNWLPPNTTLARQLLAKMFSRTL